MLEYSYKGTYLGTYLVYGTVFGKIINSLIDLMIFRAFKESPFQQLESLVCVSESAPNVIGMPFSHFLFCTKFDKDYIGTGTKSHGRF